MDVDLDNFEEALAELERHLPLAAFVSIDLEMTGINGPPNTKVSGGDVPQVQYTKSRAVVNRPYNIVQMGVCLFHETGSGKFDCRAFNIFAFPRQFNERDATGKQVKVDDHFLGLSSSSMEFLSRNGLDFSRWINKGVPYANAATEELLLTLLPEEGDATTGPPAPSHGSSHGSQSKVEPTRQQDIAFVNDTIKKIGEFAASGEKEMKLPSTNSFMALCLRQKITDKFPALTVEKRQSELNPKWQDRWVLNLSDEGRQALDVAKRRRIMGHIGVRRVWNLLKEHRRPAVFHNGFYDLLFLYSAFEGPLPYALVDFKEKVHEQFPVLLDTKVLADAPELSGCLGVSRSSLEELSKGLANILAQDGQSQDKKGDAPAAAAEVNITAVVVGAVVGASVDAGGESNSSAAVAADAGTVASAGGESNSPAAVGGANGAAGAAASGDDPDKVSVSFTSPSGFDKYADDGKAGDSFHNAGYDAYQTGRIFAYYRAKLGDQKTMAFINSVYLMFSAFQLRLAEPKDRLLYDGVARYLYDIDTSALNNRGLLELLKPVTEEGKRKAVFKWCSDNRSLILIVYGQADKAADEAERQACGQILDELLQRQWEQQRLKFQSLESHLESLTAVASARSEGNKGAAGAAGAAAAPDAKRQRVQ